MPKSCTTLEKTVKKLSREELIGHIQKVNAALVLLAEDTEREAKLYQVLVFAVFGNLFLSFSLKDRHLFIPFDFDFVIVLLAFQTTPRSLLRGQVPNAKFSVNLRLFLKKETYDLLHGQFM